MPNFFSKILKQKKIITFLLLFFITAGIVFPQITNAGVIGGAGTGATIGAVLGCGAAVGGAAALCYFTGVGCLTLGPALALCASVGLTGAKIGAVAGGVTSIGSDAGALEMAIIRGINTLIYQTVHSLADFATNWLAQNITEDKIKTSILTTPGFSDGWAQVRDFANMLIVLGFVFVGIAFTLRIEGYGTKKVLVNLILVALLVNFSGLVSGIIIDGSNIITLHFLRGNINLGTNMIHDIDIVNSKIAWDEVANAGAVAYIAAAAPFVFGMIIIAIVFFYLAIIMLVRGAIFGVFYILSPLAFFCWIFPATKKIWTMWWENFIKWALIGAQVAFFIWVASTIAKPITTTTIVNNQQVLGVNNAQILAICILLYVAVTVARKSSALGASAIMGFAAGTGMFVAKKFAGAGKSILKSAGRDIKNSAAGQKISSGVGRALEGLGLRKTGATALSRAGELGESEKRMSALVAQGDLSKVQRIAKGEGMGVTSKERGGAIAALLKSNNFDTSDGKQVAGLTHFQNQGGNLSEYSAKDPRLSRYDISATRKTMQEKKPGTTRNYTQAEAETKNVDTGYSNLGVRGMRDLSANAMDINFMRNARSDKNVKASDEYSPAQIAQQKKFITPGTKEYTDWKAKSAELKKTGTPEAMDERRRLLKNIVEIKNNPNFK